MFVSPLFVIAAAIFLVGIANATLTAEEYKKGASLFARNANASRNQIAHAEISGNLPRWLVGSLFRNGPGLFDNSGFNASTTTTFNGLMDGYGMVFKFTFDGEQNVVTWQSNFFETPRFAELKVSNTLNNEGKLMLGTHPPRKEKITKLLNLGGEVSVNIVNHDDYFFALGEISYALQFDPQTLDTVKGQDGGFFKFDDSLSDLGMGCAHPIKFPNGSMVSKLTVVNIESLATKTDYIVWRMDPNSTRRIEIARVSKLSADMIYMHAFGMTERYVVLPFWPMRVSKLGAVDRKNLFDAFKWHEDADTEIVLVDTWTGEQRTLRADRHFYGMHFVNCFEEEENRTAVTCDITAYDDLKLFPSLDVEAFRNGSSFDAVPMSAPLLRLTIPLDTSDDLVRTAYLNVSDGTPFVSEVPRMNELWRFRKYRYMYGWSPSRPRNIPDNVVAYDIETESTKTWIPDRPSIVGEPVFVPRPGASDENDGVLLVAANDIHAEKGYVAVLDAQSMSEIARATIDVHFPLGFHNLFVWGK